MMKYQRDGAAVMLGDSTSVFPARLAAYWRKKGLEVVLVTHRRDVAPNLPDGTRIVRSCEHETPVMRAITRRLMDPVLYRLERTVPYFKQRFDRRTGLGDNSEMRMPNFAKYVADAWPTKKAAMAQHPRFIFGHEVSTYGLPTALCRGVPRIIFPWGGDVFFHAESSPFHFALSKFALRAVDLIVPSSTVAARHISERFGISPEKVRAVSWGVDREIFKRASVDERRAILARWQIDRDATIILNPRRFRPDWGASVALEAFIQIASEKPSTHFIMFGGIDTEQFTRQAHARIEAMGLSSRFTLLEGYATSADCVQLMSISDVFISLPGVDMRSASVLEALAAGAAPIIGDYPEYREMERLGFAAIFVRADNTEDVVKALRFCIDNPQKVRELVICNAVYLAKHEDYSRQMDKLLGLIDEVSTRYSAR
jgi:glycosyltransferase involved in cell wall biosynthesis